MLYHEGTKDTKATKASGLALSHEVIGAAIEVHRLLGPGLLEPIYEMALCRELWLRGIEVERQACGVQLDLLVQRTIIVELKSVEKILPVHRAQPPEPGLLVPSQTAR